MSIGFYDETYSPETRARLIELYRRDGAKRLDRAYRFRMPDGSFLDFPAGFTFLVDGHTIIPITLWHGAQWAN